MEELCVLGGAMPQRAGGRRIALAVPAPHELPSVSLPQFPPSAVQRPFCSKLLNLGEIQSALVRPAGKRQGGHAGCQDPKGVGGRPSPESRPSCAA